MSSLPAQQKIKHKLGEIILYQPKSGHVRVEVKLQNETVWLTQKQMAELFNKDVRTINEHIKNIFKERELDENSVIRNFRITASDGKAYETNFYNLDVIISVGYRVKSQVGTQFRIWATRILRDHLVKGFTLNTSRLPESKLQDLKNALQLIQQAMQTKKLNTVETSGLLEVITTYAQTWLWLQEYDDDQLSTPKAPHKSIYNLTYADAQNAITELKANLIKQQKASALFGNERKGMFEGIVRTIYQTFDRKELYPGTASKAAHLLYFIIKDHPFTDGNKRIAALLFILFLSKNYQLLNKNGERKFNNNALVALTLLVAQSHPHQKDTMLALIMNFILQ